MWEDFVVALWNESNRLCIGQSQQSIKSNTPTRKIKANTLHNGGKQGIEQQNLIGNRFRTKLCILSPEISKQSFLVKSRKAEVRAEKAGKVKIKMNKSEHKLQKAECQN